ncbi:MAG: hypothetical protein ACI9SP_003991 [Arenicella sp.]|jgi:hypothetical protein
MLNRKSVLIASNLGLYNKRDVDVDVYTNTSCVDILTVVFDTLMFANTLDVD